MNCFYFRDFKNKISILFLKTQQNYCFAEAPSNNNQIISITIPPNYCLSLLQIYQKNHE